MFIYVPEFVERNIWTEIFALGLYKHHGVLSTIPSIQSTSICFFNTQPIHWNPRVKTMPCLPPVITIGAMFTVKNMGWFMALFYPHSYPL